MINQNIAIHDIESLKDNWNGNSAKPFSHELIKEIKEIYTKFIVEPDIFPTAAESIQLEWTHDNDYLELEVFENGQYHFYYTNGEKDEMQIVNRKDAIKKVNMILYTKGIGENNDQRKVK